MQYSGPSEQHYALAQSVVLSEDLLWRKFLEELSSLGSIEITDGEHVLFRERHETASRVFVITPRHLHDWFVRDRARVISKGETLFRMTELPSWFTDQLFEFVGSQEEPYDFPYVVLVGPDFSPSDDGVHPVGGTSGTSRTSPNPSGDSATDHKLMW